MQITENDLLFMKRQLSDAFLRWGLSPAMNHKFINLLKEKNREIKSLEGGFILQLRKGSVFMSYAEMKKQGVYEIFMRDSI